MSAMITKEEAIKKLGIESVDPETQDRLLSNVASAVSSRLLRLISEKLTEDDLNTLNGLIDNNQDDEVEKFIKGKYPDYDAFAIEVENEVVDELAHNKKVLDGLIEDQRQKLQSEE